MVCVVRDPLPSRRLCYIWVGVASGLVASICLVGACILVSQRRGLELGVFLVSYVVSHRGLYVGEVVGGSGV